MRYVLLFFAIMCLMILATAYTFVELYRIDKESYDRRIIAWYDGVFTYMIQKNMTNLTFEYYPEKPPHDLSEGML